VTDGNAATFAEGLRARSDCLCEAGLTADDLRRAEDEFNIAMPPLWRSVLSLVHPVELPEPARGPDGVRRWTRFPDWRLRDLDATRAMVQWPVEGVLFDVANNGFWWRAWGEPPTDPGLRLADARSALADVPLLTPLWGHLYVGGDDASPVFSIVQADLYIPFATLMDLVSGRPQTDPPTDDYPIGEVPFWSLLHAYSQVGHFTRFGDLAMGGL
jgi:hypothetical protein